MDIAFFQAGWRGTRCPRGTSPSCRDSSSSAPASAGARATSAARKRTRDTRSGSARAATREAFQVLAASLMGQHRFAEARAVAERLLALDSTSRPARAILGEIQLELGDYDQARRTFGMLFTVARRPVGGAPLRPVGGAARAARRGARALLRAARDEAGTAARNARRAPRVVPLAPRRPGAPPRPPGGGREGARGRAWRWHPTITACWTGWRASAAARGRWTRGHRSTASAPSRGRSTRPRSASCTRPTPPSGDSAKAEEYYRAHVRRGARASRNGSTAPWGLLLLDRGRDVPAVLARAEREIAVRRDVYGWDLLAWALYRSGRPTEAREAMRARARPRHPRRLALLPRGHDRGGAGPAARTARRHLETALEINPHVASLPARRGARECSAGSRRRRTDVSDAARVRPARLPPHRRSGGAGPPAVSAGARGDLPGRDWRAAAWVVTAFTAGHSLTLALAVTGALRLPHQRHRVPDPGHHRRDRDREPAGPGSRDGAAGRRYRPVFAGVFGLVHGAGFANYLRDLFSGSIAGAAARLQHRHRAGPAARSRRGRPALCRRGPGAGTPAPGRGGLGDGGGRGHDDGARAGAVVSGAWLVAAMVAGWLSPAHPTHTSGGRAVGAAGRAGAAS